MTETNVPIDAVLARLKIALAAYEEAAHRKTAAHFGRSPKTVVILSVSDIQTRARCATGVGNSFETAWRAALMRLRKQLPDEKEWQWIKADLVHSIRSATPTEILAELNATRRNYFRHGIAFDANFNTALLEQELNGIAAWVEHDGKTLGLSFERINRYLKTGRKEALLLGGVETAPEWYLFATQAIFSDRSGVLHSLASDGYGQGLREVPSLATEIETLIENAGLYLARQMRDDGTFVYGYFPAYDTVIPTYNILRHAGTLYSMLDAWEATGNIEIARRVPQGIEYILRTAMLRHGDQLFVVDHANHGEVKLGAQAVFILTLLKYITLTRDKRYLPVAQALARGIIGRFQDPFSGAFLHVLDGSTLEVKDPFRIVFYDGEATLALIRLFEVDGEQSWMNAARRAFEHFIRTDHWKHHDHWLAYCTNEITRHLPDDGYFEFGLKNVFGNLKFIRRRETAYPTFLELLMASLLLVDTMVTAKHPLLEKYDIRALVETIDHRASHQRFACLYPEMAMYFKSPGKIKDSFFSRHHSFRIRIDDVEHFISGYCLYLHNVLRVRASAGPA
ncbi:MULTISPECIES: hypothetical protein [unclassified Rhizobium]|uniref:hypothetical protein n=1 Tax=unclassified Rhizobium TaxID=2613769 RepID=UPI000714E55C|nr:MULTISPECIES: hypothetical protein [unclassified Rhizobium]KQS83504.1 hypothetical protein ASG50_30640 [Rhizobium sp. Leaf386]KQT03746.1 hypothetical protein ASG42_23800 [Rhizobium sp. Leaf391]KQU03597.1 hypothetical protein ASG68_26645 [Rhizobium sp. Leaf453]